MSFYRKLFSKIERFYRTTPIYRYSKQMESRYERTSEGKKLMGVSRELSSASIFSKKFWSTFKKAIKK